MSARQQVIELIWQGRPPGGTVHLQVSRSKSFEAGQLEVDAAGSGQRQRSSSAGRAPEAIFGEWQTGGGAHLLPSGVRSRRFRVFSSTNEKLLEDTTPPDLFVSPPQQLGNMFIVEGATEVTATITVNGERVELSADGRFRKTVEIYKEGWNEIVVVATDPSGNQTGKTGTRIRGGLLMHLSSLFGLFSSDLAIDLGTANTLVYVRGRGIAVVEPSIVAVNRITNRVEAVGAKAKEMLGKTPSNIQAIRPMKDGVIADFEVTEKMLEHFIRKAHGRSFLVRPRIIISVPSEITQVEKRAVKDTALKAGASEVYLIEQATAAAIGAGLPITEPSGNMIVDIGGGTSDVAVISLAGVVYSRSVRVAGNEMDEAIIHYLKKKYNLLLGERTAEQIKIEIGSAYPLDEPLSMEVKGRDLVEGVPKNLTITDEEIREALTEIVSTIVDAVRNALEQTPPELSADIMDKGIILAGGGSLLKNLDKRLREETGLPVAHCEEPGSAVVRGTGMMLTNIDLLRKIAIA